MCSEWSTHKQPISSTLTLGSSDPDGTGPTRAESGHVTSSTVANSTESLDFIRDGSEGVYEMGQGVRGGAGVMFSNTAFSMQQEHATTEIFTSLLTTLSSIDVDVDLVLEKGHAAHMTLDTTVAHLAMQLLITASHHFTTTTSSATGCTVGMLLNHATMATCDYLQLDSDQGVNIKAYKTSCPSPEGEIYVLETVPPHGTECASVWSWDNNICQLLWLMILGCDTIRNSNHFTSTEGEEKGPQHGNDAWPGLVDKLVWWYNLLHYILGYYCHGSKMTITVITTPPTPMSKPDLHDILMVDFAFQRHHIVNMVHMINLISILPTLAHHVQSMYSGVGMVQEVWHRPQLKTMSDSQTHRHP
ncbi:hypothetical protein EDC04DRAFT_2604480 [Pisolithus marmoratus]|nr:hypothetical protein EDC04DRAFT_2604480 [Pisolithus marmoratus]